MFDGVSKMLIRVTQSIEITLINLKIQESDIIIKSYNNT